MKNIIIKIEKIIPLILSSILLFLFFQIQSSYHSPQSLLDSNPNVTNLKSHGKLSSLKIGVSPVCNDHPCWVEKNFDDSGWQKFALPLNPNSNITQLKGYSNRNQDSKLFYRTNLNFEKEFLDKNFEISFAQIFINHKTYSAYVNDKLVMTSNGKKLGSIANISIPKSSVVNNSVVVTIVGSLQEDDRGISHFGSSYVGPKTVLDNVF